MDGLPGWIAGQRECFGKAGTNFDGDVVCQTQPEARILPAGYLRGYCQDNRTRDIRYDSNRFDVVPLSGLSKGSS